MTIVDFESTFVSYFRNRYCDYCKLMCTHWLGNCTYFISGDQFLHVEGECFFTLARKFLLCMCVLSNFTPFYNMSWGGKDFFSNLCFLLVLISLISVDFKLILL